MSIASFLSSLFHREKRIVITIDEARRRAKSCYLNEDLAGARRWNNYIAKTFQFPLVDQPLSAEGQTVRR